MGSITVLVSNSAGLDSTKQDNISFFECSKVMESEPVKNLLDSNSSTYGDCSLDLQSNHISKIITSRGGHYTQEKRLQRLADDRGQYCIHKMR